MVAPICRLSITIKILITFYTINIFWTNEAYYLSLLNFISNRNNKIRITMAIAYFKIIKRKRNSKTSSSKKLAKCNFSICNCYKFSTRWSGYINTMMIRRSAASWRTTLTKTGTNCCISRNWPNKSIRVYTNYFFIKI